MLLKCSSEYYDCRSHLDKFKVTDPVDGTARYFALQNHNRQWYRVEPMDVRMGQSIRVNNTLDVYN